MRNYFYSLLTEEISSVTRFCDRAVQVSPVPSDDGTLLARIDAPSKDTIADPTAFTTDDKGCTGILLNGNFNYEGDIHALLRELARRMARRDRILLVAYNPYIRWLYTLADRLRLRRAHSPGMFLRFVDLQHLCRLNGLEIVRRRSVGYVPWHALGIGSFLNRLLAGLPFVSVLGLATVCQLRPTRRSGHAPTLTVVVPARNERGNIRPCLQRLLAAFGSNPPDITFVEGHSTDGTWEEIQSTLAEYTGPATIRALRQEGTGKADAVRLGFSQAKTELVTILDANLSMPPELLPRFYEAWCDGHGDFVNGNRLLYPMEQEAMRFLNLLGNIFFSKALSFVLGARLGDCLCGTKLLAKRDYDRCVAWRRRFGDFNPFGDFELLFPAAELGLGIVDIAVRYRARTYGSTNIRRFYHGFMLLKMTLIGLWRVRLGKPVGTHAARTAGSRDV